MNSDVSDRKCFAVLTRVSTLPLSYIGFPSGKTLLPPLHSLQIPNILHSKHGLSVPLCIPRLQRPKPTSVVKYLFHIVILQHLTITTLSPLRAWFSLCQYPSIILDDFLCQDFQSIHYTVCLSLGMLVKYRISLFKYTTRD